jgi:Concanavalin A-like lectin/glucanases superfamily/Domain of unknown function (DUF2341)/Carboxypeptidase regulatory-like domain
LKSALLFGWFILILAMTGCISDRASGQLAGGGDATETGNARIQGRLIDENGEPVPMATVTAYPPDHDPSAHGVVPAFQRAVTNAKGEFHFDSLPEGFWNLEAREPSRRLAHLTKGIELGETKVTLGSKVLQSPGNLNISLVDGSTHGKDGYVFVQGTSSYARIDSLSRLQNQALLYDVAPGELPNVILAYQDSNGNDTRQVLADSLYLPPGGSIQIAPYMSWLKHVRLNIASGANGLSLNETLDGLAVPIRLTPDFFDFSLANRSGSDIRVTNSENKTLSISLEQFEPAIQSGLVWVRLDSLPANAADEYVTLHYGHPSSHSARTTAFDTTKGYSLVWHLNEEAPGNTTNNLHQDATLGGSLGNDRVNYNALVGVLGLGKSIFVGDYIQYPNLRPILKPETTFTVQAWIRCVASSMKGGAIIDVGGSYGIRILFSGDASVYYWPTVSRSAPETPYYHATTTGAGLVSGTWHLITGTLGGGQLKIYVDGQLKAQVAAGDKVNYSFASNVTVGANAIPNPDFNFMGDIDQVEIHWVERSAEWVRASYESQRPNSTFLKIAPN